MTDNTELNTASGGDVIATDDIGGIKHQRVKVQHGADGSATDVSTASPLPVTDIAAKADDEAFTLTSDSVSVAGAIRDDALATLAAAEGDAVPLRVGESGALWMSLGPSVVDSGNSSIATLAGAAVFTGTAVDILSYGVVTVFISSDVDSATDGVSMELSSDGSNWDEVRPFNYIAANDGALYQIAAAAQFFRIVYTNGGTLQAHFRLQTILHPTFVAAGTHRLVDDEDPDGSTVLVKAAMIAQKAGAGDFIPIQSTTGGNLKVSIEESNGAITGGGVEATALRVTMANDSTGLLNVNLVNTVSTNNSSVSVLAGAATFTGTGDDCKDFAAVTVQVDASHDSAVDGMTFQFSTDNSNWDDVYPFTYTAADGARRFQFPVTGQFFRVVYTNGGTLQTHFRLQTILHKQPVTSSVHRIVDTVDPDRSAQIVKAAIVAQAAGSGDFVPVQTTATGNLKVSLEEYDGVPTGGGVESGALRVTVASDSTGVLSVDDNGGTLTVDNSGLTKLDGAISGSEMQVDIVAALPAGTNNIGDVDVLTLPSLPAGSNNIGDVDVLTIAAGANLVGDVGLSGARTSGGTTLYKNIDVDETEDAIKASAGQIYWIHAINLKATPLFLKFYNATVASVVVGTTTPDLTFPVPSAGDTNGAGFTLAIPNGIAFGTAITVAATTDVADTDTGAPGANELILNLGYA